MPVDLSTLNEGQLKAVQADIEKPCLVVAGAGSGKTTTLTARLEHVVQDGVDPSQVIAMTFTRKAAGEFAERLEGGPAEGVWSGTIHSFAYARLRAYLEAVEEALPEVVTHPKNHVRNLIGRPSRDRADEYREAVRDAPEIDLSAVLGRIGHWQNELTEPAKAREEAIEWIDHWAARIYDAYTRWKRRTNRIDFGDMLSLAIEAYEADAKFLASDRKRFRFALVDELQDTNTAQWVLMHLLWKDQPLFGVGDPRQAIYEWRGARPDQLLGFTAHWPDATVVKLADNYRSTPQIIDVAEALIAGTTEASASGRLVPNRTSGAEPVLELVDTQADEAEFVGGLVQEIIDLYSPGPFHVDRPGDIAILYRTNAQSADFENELARRQIPYQVVGSKGFWARREVRQLLAYLHLAEDPNDREAFATALMAPSRFLGRAFVDAAAKMSADRGFSLVEAAAHVTSYSGRTLNAAQAFEASNFTTLIRSLVGMRPAEALERVLRVSEFRRWLARNEGTTDSADDDRDDVISKLLDQAGHFDTPGDLIAHADQQASKSSSGSKPDPRRVQLMTIHRAKGLEWPVVFVAGFSEGLLPHAKGNIEEERRLAYVAMTRARDVLYLVSPQSTYQGPTGVSEFAIDSGLMTPAAAATGGVVT